MVAEIYARYRFTHSEYTNGFEPGNMTARPSLSQGHRCGLFNRRLLLSRAEMTGASGTRNVSMNFFTAVSTRAHSK
jgi:hypothetical protein